MGIFLILLEASSLERTFFHLLSEASVHNAKLSDLLTQSGILVLKVIDFTFQISLHVGNVVPAFAHLLSCSCSLLTKLFNSSELSLHRDDLLAQEVLFLLKSVILTLDRDQFVLPIGC